MILEGKFLDLPKPKLGLQKLPKKRKNKQSYYFLGETLKLASQNNFKISNFLKNNICLK